MAKVLLSKMTLPQLLNYASAIDYVKSVLKTEMDINSTTIYGTKEYSQSSLDEYNRYNNIQYKIVTEIKKRLDEINN